MPVSNGPKLGLIINAATGDTFDTDFRKLLRAIDGGWPTLFGRYGTRGCPIPLRSKGWAD